MLERLCECDLGKLSCKFVVLFQATKASFSHANWGPQDPKKYEEWKEFKLKAEEKRIMKGRSHFKHILLVVFLGKD